MWFMVFISSLLGFRPPVLWTGAMLSPNRGLNSAFIAQCFTPFISAVCVLIMAIQKWVFSDLFLHFVFSKAGTGSQHTKFRHFFTTAKFWKIWLLWVSSLNGCREPARVHADASVSRNARCSRVMCDVCMEAFRFTFLQMSFLALNWYLWNVSEFNTISSSCWTSPSRMFLLEPRKLESHLLAEGTPV